MVQDHVVLEPLWSRTMWSLIVTWVQAKILKTRSLALGNPLHALGHGDTINMQRLQYTWYNTHFVLRPSSVTSPTWGQGHLLRRRNAVAIRCKLAQVAVIVSSYIRFIPHFWHYAFRYHADQVISFHYLQSWLQNKFKFRALCAYCSDGTSEILARVRWPGARGVLTYSAERGCAALMARFFTRNP